MDARLIAACCLALLAPIAQADIYSCRSADGHRSIQDRPCPRGTTTDLHVRDAGNRAAKPQRASKPAREGGGGGVPLGLKDSRNKGVICGLLAAEKLEAQNQIAGRAPPPVGEDPAENLVKIERQRSRVACGE